eukprot:779370_1
MPFFKRLSLVGIANSFLCSIALIVIIISNLHLLNNLDNCTNNIPQNTFPTIHNQIQHINSDVSNEPTRKIPTKKIYQYYNNANFNMYLSSLTSNPTLNPSSPILGNDCIVFLSDPNIINSTLGAIYNMREPSLGNWSEC